MSLPEVLLVLREDHRRESTRALLALQTEALAAFAVWDKESGRKLDRFRKDIAQSLSAENQPGTKDLAGVFSAWGASIENSPD